MIISIFSILVAASFLMFSYINIKKFTEVKKDEAKINKTYLPIEKQKKVLSTIKSSYENLQKEYLSSLKALKQNEEKLSRFNLGVGTMDIAVYKKSFEIDQLPNLENELVLVKDLIKEMITKKTACVCDQEWVVNNRRAEGKKLTNREIKLRIRCLDNEVKAAMALVDWHNINRLIKRLEETFEEINSSAHVIKAYLKKPYLDLKIRELKLFYEITNLKQELKDLELEDRKVKREAEREEARIVAAAQKATSERELMEKLVEQELAKLVDSTEEQKQLLELHKEELAVLKEKELRAISMAQQTRAGFVYVISNESSFGQGVCKIGMTRRVDPNERVKELGDASVPELFDVHAFIYSEDAPKLEKYLHHKFSTQRVNLVNSRKEFFNVEHKKVVAELDEYEEKLDINLFEVESKKEPELQIFPEVEPIGTEESKYIVEHKAESKLQIVQEVDDLPKAIDEPKFIVENVIVENVIDDYPSDRYESTKDDVKENKVEQGELKEKKKKKNKVENQENMQSKLRPMNDLTLKDKIKEYAQNEWPDDIEMQEHIYKKQLKSKQFMDKVQDEEIKLFAITEYPDDYSMQEHVYKKQLKSKRYMDKVQNDKVKTIAITEYPGDYSMQEYVYNKQLKSKQFMNEVQDEEIKSFTVKEYPEDDSMQENVNSDQWESKQFMDEAQNEEIKRFAVTEYPNNYSMQEDVYSEQLESKQFMDEVQDEEVKRFAFTEYPNNYSMQEDVYSEQLESKQFMDEAQDEEIKRFAVTEYPNNYSMQVDVYSEQLESKQFMDEAQNEEIKRFAVTEYPNNYSMQEDVYSEQLESK
jgi:hypothetical protein